jgi:hypothetical protein
MTSNYKNGKIYKMCCDGLTYIGSTIQKLSQRKGEHKRYYKQYLKDDVYRCSSTELFKLEKDIEIFLIEEFPCENKTELLIRERYWYDVIDCVNHQLPYRTPDEVKEYNRLARQKYRQSHKEQIAIKNKIYKQNPIYKQNQKEYRQLKKLNEN